MFDAYVGFSDDQFSSFNQRPVRVYAKSDRLTTIMTLIIKRLPGRNECDGADPLKKTLEESKALWLTWRADMLP